MRARLAGRRRDRGNRGAAALEFALVLIPLLLIVGGILNFGVVLSQKLAMDNAARQGARYAAVAEPTASPNVETKTRDAMDGTLIAKGNLTPSEPNVAVASSNGTANCEDSDFGDSITVTVSATAKFLLPWPVPGLPKTVGLTSRGEYQCEYS